MSLDVRKIYIIHYLPLVSRKKNIENYFANNNITNYEFKNKYQRECLTDELKNKYFNKNNLNNAQICITIEHIETYREIVKNGHDNVWYLILEDDAEFCDNFINKLNILLKNVPNDAEYLDISDYFKINSNSNWVRENITRTTVSYLVKKRTCEKLLNTIIPFEKAIDHELNTQFKIHNMNVYWSGESLISQGSAKYGSSYIQY